MDELEIKQFKLTFKQIVYQKGKITECNNRIRQLTKWDKNGSHKEAILRAIGKRDEQKKIVEEMLKGLSYDDWKSLSKRISYCCQKLKGSRDLRLRYQNDLNKIKMP
jgi:NAD+--asparagine ADP-ribosyltransferase